ncbi:MAG: Ig-like domain-containing protein [Verrucomicrobiota bacterium]
MKQSRFLQRVAVSGIVVTGLIWLAGTNWAATNYTVVGWNNLGMHCMDSDYSVFSILPPYNTINAQLIRGINGTASVINAGITITYQAVADPAGSINTTSAGKGNWYDYMGSPGLIGVTLPVDWGLPVPNLIYHMPGTNNVPQAMTPETSWNWFVAYGIPVFPTDDALKPNQYPMMRLVARDSLNQVLATTDIVLPVSDEMNCRLCHLSGSGPDARPSAGWVNDPNPGRDYRLNILRLHDDRQWTNHASLYAAALASNSFNTAGLYATVVIDKKPFICAKCHLSEALPFGPLLGIPQLTTSIHGRHASVIDPRSNLTLDADNNRVGCYTCHPGSVTRCLRGAMGKAVNPADGSMAMQCQSCHGNMSAVGDPTRVGWYKEPTCQACHSGDAVSNSGQIRFTDAFTNGVMRVPTNTRFATTDNVRFAPYNLYRFSTCHGGVKCSGCHGSTHAEFPSAFPNDNVTSQTHQGHAGVLVECAVCHGSNPAYSVTKSGPHGMHPTGWNTGHGGASGNSGTSCMPCHGPNLTGTILSRAQANRPTFTKNWDQGPSVRAFWRGTQIGCFDCHDGPGDHHHDILTTHPAPTVGVSSASTSTGYSVVLGPSVSAGTLRVVAQPANGTVAISNNTLAVYFPGQGFAGTDTFTYASNDGWRDSNLATGTVYVTAQYSLGDGVPDWWRLLNFGCVSCPEAAANADPDGDGFSNAQEFTAGTDPNDGRSTVRVFDFHLTSGTAAFNFTSLLGNLYRLESRDDLVTGSWAIMKSNIWGMTDSTSVVDTNAAARSKRFYRVRALP